MVGLDVSWRVGLSPPPVSCLMSAGSVPPVRPVNWRARVVVPVFCGATPPKTLLLPVYDGTRGVLRVGEGEPRRVMGRMSYRGNSPNSQLSD